MKGRDQCKGASSTDLLVCFPSRAHLSLMPKPICSPSRPSEPNKQRSHHHRKRSFSRGGAGGSRGAGGQASSPLLWSKSRQVGSDISEPTSPKVTCAGQIKVRPRSGPRPGSCKNWRSVMEEIEKLHNERKQKRPSWVEALGIKKDAMQFLACLRNIRFDFRCFGSFPTSDIITSDDEEEDEDDEEEKDDESSRTVFSKWFMVLQENQGNGLVSKEKSISTVEENIRCDDITNNNEEYTASAPPSNALLLMRCRSAPAKSWLEEREEEDKREEERKEKLAMEEEMEMKKKRENLVVMRYYENNNDFYKISSDIAKETWVVGGIKDPVLSRSRSSKR